MDMSKTYNPREFEEKLYKEWEKKGYFRAEVSSKKQPFSIVIPPPNITGQLHMGQAFVIQIYKHMLNSFGKVVIHCKSKPAPITRRTKPFYNWQDALLAIN